MGFIKTLLFVTGILLFLAGSIARAIRYDRGNNHPIEARQDPFNRKMRIFWTWWGALFLPWLFTLIILGFEGYI
jgi:hypothetical protein